MFSEYLAIVLAKSLIVLVFLMGMVSLGMELYNGTLPL